MFRFIDDLTVLDDGGGLSRFLKRYIPPELVLKKKNKSNSEGSVSDLLAKTENQQFSTNLFDKIKNNGKMKSVIKHSHSNFSKNSSS